jgi:hypothetical protein
MSNPLGRTVTPDEYGRYGVAGTLAYHYTTADVALRHIVPDKTLLLNPFSRMRDPIENKDWLRSAGYIGGRNHEEWGPGLRGALRRSKGWTMGKLNRDDHQKAINAVRDASRRLQRFTKVLSFTHDAPPVPEETYGMVWADAYGRGYARPRMWEQYGDNHRGVCLAFDRELLYRGLMAPLKGLGSTFAGAIDYSVEHFTQHSRVRSLYAHEVLALGAGSYDLGMRRHVERHIFDLFFTKLPDWESEREYRYVVLAEDEDRNPVSFGDALRAVIVGESFPDSGLHVAQTVCANAGAELGKVRWGPFPPEVFDPFEGPVVPAADPLSEL